MQKISANRIYEMLPGAMVWITIFSALFLSYFYPLEAIYFIIIFDIYWLLRILYLLIYMLHSWKKYRQASRINWWKKLSNEKKEWEKYFHLIFLPVYNESLDIIEAAFTSIARCSYDTKKFIIVLTGEERSGKDEFLRKAHAAEQKYSKYFKKIFINVHPARMPDEIPGKGSNLNHAGWQVKKIIDEWEIPYEKIIVSCFDIDTQPHAQYFAFLAYTYLNTPDPTRASYQPIAVYNNNVWESNPVIRVVASSTTFWLFTDLARPERLFTFSSHSMSFQSLVRVGFWDKTIVTEDSKIFLQCLVHFDGNYRVIPLHIPVFMNTVEVGKFWTSLSNQYKQIRRWAWGIEHFPWMMTNFFHKKNSLPLMKKIYYTWNILEGNYSWATAPILIYIVGHFPLWIAQWERLSPAVFQNAPLILSYLMGISMVGIICIAVMYTTMLPPRPDTVAKRHSVIIFLQWMLTPVTLIIFGSIPSLDAQTRLLLGGKFRLGFWVSEKKLASKVAAPGEKNQ